MDKQEISETPGWIKLWRRLKENPLMQEPRLLQVFIYCLLSAVHKETKFIWNGKELTLAPGQFLTGRNKANKDLKLKGKMFSRKLEVLENIGIVTRKVTNKFSIITIVNWEEYQSRQGKMTSKMTNRRPTSDHIQEVNKNVKEETATKNVDDVLSQIFKGTVNIDKIKDQIKGKDTDELIALARYCVGGNARNPAGLFLSMLKEGTKPPAQTREEKFKIPPPKGGYQTGLEPLDQDDDGLPKEKPRVDGAFLKKIHKDVLKFKKEIRDKQKSQTA